LQLIRNRLSVRGVTLVAIAVAVAALAYFILSFYVSRMISQSAEVRSKSWAENLIANVSDLPEIIDGEIPSDESILFLEQARAIGNVWLFRIYDADGKLILSSNDIGGAYHVKTSLSQSHPEAFEVARTGAVYATTREKMAEHEPAFIAESVGPIRFDGKMIGYVGLLVDETETRANTLQSATYLAGLLSLIIAVAFGAPAAAFVQRTRQKEIAEGQLQHLAYHDTLTNLPNRLSITRLLNEELSAKGNTALALHLIDLDHFKIVNDTLGHHAGDSCLKEVAVRLAQIVQGHGLVGRLGGDEFLVVQLDATDEQNVSRLAEKIVLKLSEPATISGQAIDTGASVGSALAVVHGNTAAELMKVADVSLYVAKTAGR
jgi:diguanylate cyclase (GGDEF)-like protein